MGRKDWKNTLSGVFDVIGEVLAVDEAVERPMGEEARELSFPHQGGSRETGFRVQDACQVVKRAPFGRREGFVIQFEHRGKQGVGRSFDFLKFNHAWLWVTGYELQATSFAKVGIIIKTCARFALIAGAFLKPFAAGAVYGLEQMIGLEVGGNRFSFGLPPGETERVRAFAGTCFPVRAGVFSRFR